MNKEEALKFYAQDGINTFHKVQRNKDEYFEVLDYLRENDLMDEAHKVFAEAQENFKNSVIKPLKQELISFLSDYKLIFSKDYINRGLKLRNELKEHDQRYLIRLAALQEFFESPIGSELSLKEKINITLKVGALDTEELERE